MDREGVFKRAELAEWEIDDTALRALAKRGLLERIRHGIYVEGESWGLAAKSPERRHLIELRGAVMALGCPAYAFAESAALLWGLPLPFQAPRELNLVRDLGRDGRSLRQPSAHPITLPGASIITHQLAPEQKSAVAGIPTVNLALAAVSCAARLHADWPVVVLDSALWRDEQMRLMLESELDGWPQFRGRSRALRALELARSGAQTPLETLSRLGLIRQGLPEPRLQEPFSDAEGLIGVVDMFWPTLGVIGEADGLIKYESRDALIAEKRREDRLRALGFAVVRWGWGDVMERPEAVAQRIRRAALWAA